MKAARILQAGMAAALLALAGCRGGGPTDPGPTEEGIRFSDSGIVVDQYGYYNANCAEILPAVFANTDSVPAGTVMMVTVISTACYAVHIDIVDSAGTTKVRSMDRWFKIYGRTDGEKNRGKPSYLAWDGKDDQGAPVKKAKYRWRLDFNFGAGQTVKYYGPMWLE